MRDADVAGPVVIDPAALTQTTATAMASGLAALLLAAIAFPVRWFVEFHKARRQAAQTAAREARRVLRHAILASRRQLTEWLVKPTPEIERGAASPSVREAFEHVCWILAELPETALYDIVERAAGLYERRGAVRAIYAPQEAPDPGDELIALADRALSVRVRRARGGLRTIARDLDAIDELITHAEAEFEHRHRQRRVGERENEQHTARTTAHGDSGDAGVGGCET